MPIRPKIPLGRPLLELMFVHESPLSDEINIPLPVPPLDSIQGFLLTSHIEAHKKSGLSVVDERSAAPVCSF